MNIKEENLKFKSEKEPLLSFKKKSSNFLFSSNKNEKGIIAGYHWFREWGRDTMISLPSFLRMS